MARFRYGGRLPLLVLVMVVAELSRAAAQDSVRIEGTIRSIDGQTLTVLSDAPINRGRVSFGLSLEPVPAPRPTFTVDVGQLAASDYVFLREGQHVTVFGVLSQDGRRVTATSIPGARRPEAP